MPSLVKKMAFLDVRNFLMYRESLNVPDTEMVHKMAVLSNIFKFVGNTTYEVDFREYFHLKVSALFEAHRPQDSGLRGQRRHGHS